MCQGISLTVSADGERREEASNGQGEEERKWLKKGAGVRAGCCHYSRGKGCPRRRAMWSVIMEILSREKGSYFRTVFGPESVSQEVKGARKRAGFSSEAPPASAVVSLQFLTGWLTW